MDAENLPNSNDHENSVLKTKDLAEMGTNSLVLNKIDEEVKAACSMKDEIQILRERIMRYKQELDDAKNDANALRIANNEFRILMLSPTACVDYANKEGWINSLQIHRRTQDFSKLDTDTQIVFQQLLLAHLAIFNNLLNSKTNKAAISNRIMEKSLEENEKVKALRENRPVVIKESEAAGVNLTVEEMAEISQYDPKLRKAIYGMMKGLKVNYSKAKEMLSGMLPTAK